TGSSEIQTKVTADADKRDGDEYGFSGKILPRL
ncbi:hypothetical protein A2U01_0108785, partial [Trifolium medium]|nr:hypothetical protein [Trifolium medium]